MKTAVIITTINPKSKAIKEYEKKYDDIQLYIVGDRKSVEINSNDRLTFFSLDDQLLSEFKYAKLCPENHYARKNLGYLYAIKDGATVIYDTDDDNIPITDKWTVPSFTVNRKIVTDSNFYNIYSNCTKKNVWPRGYPLDKIKLKTNDQIITSDALCGVIQGLADNDPDVDAIYRLVDNDPVFFESFENYALDNYTYTPFNSQNTFWNSQCFPLMYLPCTVAFRFTDILRSYIAQPVLWSQGFKVGVMPATVYQKRNDHNFLEDFRSELSCFLDLDKVIEILSEKTLLSGSISENLVNIYSRLADANIVEEKEVEYLKVWLNDLERVLL